MFSIFGMVVLGRLFRDYLLIFSCLVFSVVVVWLANVPPRCDWCGLMFEGVGPDILYVFSLVFGFFVMVVVTFYSIVVFLKEKILSGRHLFSFLVFVLFLVFVFFLVTYSFYMFGPLIFRRNLFVRDNRSGVAIFSNGSMLNVNSSGFLARRVSSMVFDYSKILTVILIVSFVLLYLSYNKSKEKYIERRVSKPGIKNRERSIKSYSKGLFVRIDLTNINDRRLVILIYNIVHSILIESGVPDDNSLTAREFEDRAKNFLPMELQECFHKLTYIFEEAKYSHHLIHKDMRNEALETLHRIQASYQNQ
ncbi:MAG: DUF4129 domain-containing protein [Thermoproteales archaeon]|nr:DUF4129 domain-containing protein [Thermoproteales archaeon]